MTNEQATNILIQAAVIGQAKGAYDLQSAKMIALAVETLAPAPVKTVETPVEEAKDETPVAV